MSNRRRIKPPKRRQHPAAHLDGTRLPGSCCNTAIAVYPARYGCNTIGVLHDDDCDALGDDPRAAAAARLRASLALARLIDGPIFMVVES